MRTKMKNLLKSAGIFALISFLSMGAVSAQDMSIGAALKASTTGFGGDIVFQFHERMTARLGYDALSVNYPTTINESDIEFDVDLNYKAGTILALYDFYLLKFVYVSAGLGINNFGIYALGEATDGMPYGDITVPKEKVGSFDITIRPGMKISPYLGLGFGRTLGKKLGFGFEIGSFYQGSPDFTIETTGLLAPTSDPELGQEELLESQFSQYYLYPVIKFSVSYNIYSF